MTRCAEHTLALDVYHGDARVGHVGGVRQPVPRTGTRGRRRVVQGLGRSRACLGRAGARSDGRRSDAQAQGMELRRGSSAGGVAECGARGSTCSRIHGLAVYNFLYRATARRTARASDLLSFLLYPSSRIASHPRPRHWHASAPCAAQLAVSLLRLRRPATSASSTPRPSHTNRQSIRRQRRAQKIQNPTGRR
jgi:hypothetical protein